VYLTPIYSGEQPSHMSVTLVRFTPGAHTNWHSHAVGQTLHVTECDGGDPTTWREPLPDGEYAAANEQA
jgi:hypothetical protein